MRARIGITAVTFGPVPAVRAAGQAAALGFDHLDVGERALAELTAPGAPTLPLPVGDVIAEHGYPARRTAVAPVLRPGDDYDELVRTLRAHPGCRLEPGPGTVAGSVAAARALAEAVPGLRLCVDTGHVATWGEDPVALLDLADHVQLRQAAPGHPQLHPDEGGDVDFAAVLGRLRALGYRGLLSVEYFDLPRYGWPLAEPVAHATALRDHVRHLVAL